MDNALGIFAQAAERRMIMATGFNTQVSNGEYSLQFETDNKEYYLLMQETAMRCVDGKPVTNADRVRSMSDEELANVLREFATKPMQGSFLKWLQNPAE